MSGCLKKKKKFFNILLYALLIGFFSINNIAYSQMSDINFDMNPDLNPYNNNYYQQYTDESDVYYKHGLDFFNSNQYSKAIDSFEKALNIAPEKANTRVNLAAAYINRGTYFYSKLKDIDKASNDYRNAIYILKYDSNIPNSNIGAENLGIAKINLDNLFKDAKISTTKSFRLKTAKELRGQGKFREALVEFYESLEGNRNDVVVYIAIADISSILKNDKNAVKYYQKAIIYNQNNVELHLKLATAMHNSGDIDNAIKEYNIALNIAKKEDKIEVLQHLEDVWTKKLQENPQNASAHMNLAVVLQKKGDFEGALKEYQFAEAINPSDISTRLNIGTLYQANKNYNVALKAYDTVLQVEPDNISAHYYKGTVLRDIGQLDDAIKEFQYVLNKNPDNINAKEALFETIKQFPDGQEATDIFKTFAENNPTDAFAQYKYAYRLHSLKRTTEALEYYRKTIALDPKFTDSYLNIAVIYKEKNQLSNAISILQTGLKAVPQNKKLKEMLASISSEKAMNKYQNALKKYNQGKYDEAIKEYLNIIQISEPDADLYINLGVAYQAAKKYNDATNAYIKATKIESNNSTAFYYMGTAYSAQNKNQEAANAYKKALALDPENNDIKQALANANKTVRDNTLQKGINEYNKGKYNEALLTFNTLSMKDSNNGYVYYYRGMVYDALKKFQLAIADYKLAVRYSSELTYAYYAVAVDYDTLKNYTEAKKWYRFFIEKSGNTSDQYVKYAKDRIKQI